MTIKELSDYIEKSLSASLGDDFDINTEDNKQIILAIGSHNISVDMDSETVCVDVLGYSIPDTPYNEHMVKFFGGADAVSRELIAAGKSEYLITRFSIDYMGDNAEEIGKALVAVRDLFRNAAVDLAGKI